MRKQISPPSWELIPVPSMKRQRSSTLESVDEDEGDKSKPLFDHSETVGSAPTLLSDDADEDDLVITSGPLPLRPRVSSAQEPPTPISQKVAATIILDDDDDDCWMMPSPAKLPSTRPGLGGLTLQELRSRKEELELIMLQESSTPEAITGVEDQARMQAQKRPEVVQSPLVLNTPNSSKAHGKSLMVEAEEREKILIEVLDKYGVIQPIRIFMTDKFERLFKVYAEVSDLSPANLSFRINGEEIAPNSTPKDHAMEDGELIEVYENI